LSATAAKANVTKRVLFRRAALNDSDSDGILVNTTDRTELVNLRQPRSLPKDYLERNHLDPAVAKEQEDRYAGINAQVNSVVGYIPPSCLWLRDDILIDLVKTNKEFHAVIAGVEYTVAVPTEGSPEDKVTAVKQAMRSKYGGNLRKDASSYVAQLTKVIGKLTIRTKDLTYQLTLPGASPFIKVEA